MRPSSIGRIIYGSCPTVRSSLSLPYGLLAQKGVGKNKIGANAPQGGNNRCASFHVKKVKVQGHRTSEISRKWRKM